MNNRKRYRLLFLNEREEKVVFSVRLYTWVAALLLTLLITMTAVLVILIMTRTPLKGLLPGYLDVNKKTELAEATLRLDSLERESRLRTVYLQNLTDILSGRVQVDSIASFSSEAGVVRFDDSLRVASEREEAFTAAFEEQERYSLNALGTQPAATGLSFIPPVKGAYLNDEVSATTQTGVETGVRRVYELRIAPVRPYVVLAPADGVAVAVYEAVEDGTWTVLLQHLGDCLTELSHLATVDVAPGHSVRVGSVVGHADDASKTADSEPAWVGIRVWQRGVSVDPQQVMGY